MKIGQDLTALEETEEQNFLIKVRRKGIIYKNSINTKFIQTSKC